MHIKVVFMLCGLMSAMLQPMDIDSSHSNFMQGTYPFKTEERVIQDYFVEPSKDNIKRWFKSLNGVTVGDLAQDSCEFYSCENKANMYSSKFSRYGGGNCTYAAEYENYLLAGFLKGSILVRRNLLGSCYHHENIVLESPQKTSGFYEYVTACYLAEDNELILAGYSDFSLWLLNLKTKIHTRICSLPKPIDLIVKGHMPHVLLTSGGGYFSVIYIDKNQGKILYHHIPVGQDTQVTGLAPYTCGVAVRTTKEALLYMPYSVQDYDTLEAYRFSPAQKECLIRLIGAKKLGMKPAVRESERESFAALPAFMQEMLLE